MKKEVYFNIELDDNTVLNTEGHIKTLDDAKSYVQNIVDNDKNFFVRVAPAKIVKYEKYCSGDKVTCNVLMEIPFAVNGSRIKYN